MAPVIQDALNVFRFVKRIPEQYRKLVCYLFGHLPLVAHPRGETCPRCGDVWLDLEEIKRKNREQERNADAQRQREIDAENPQRAATPVPHETTDTPGMKA